jgi:hypothetical protein
MLKPDSTAMPALATTVVVPLSLAPGVPVPLSIATVTDAPDPVTVFPKASCTATRTAGVSALPACAVLGCPVKTSRAAALGVMLNAVLVAAVSPLAVAVSV